MPTKAGKTLVRLVPVAAKRRTGFGADKGKIWIRNDFDAPLPKATQRAFGVKR